MKNLFAWVVGIGGLFLIGLVDHDISEFPEMNVFEIIGRSIVTILLFIATIAAVMAILKSNNNSGNCDSVSFAKEKYKIEHIEKPDEDKLKYNNLLNEIKLLKTDIEKDHIIPFEPELTEILTASDIETLQTTLRRLQLFKKYGIDLRVD